MLSAKSKNYIEGQPNVNDVLYGSGKGAYNHNGNQVFHAKVKDSLKEYYEVKTHRSKQEIASRVIREIASADPPGRFLKYDKANSKWYEVEADESLNKTQQQFRNRVSMDRKEALRKSKEEQNEKSAEFRPENFNFSAKDVADSKIIDVLGDIFLEVMDLNAKYENLDSKDFGSLVMNLPGRGQLKIFQAASTLVYATQADQTRAVEIGNKRPRQNFVAASADVRPEGNPVVQPTPPPHFVPTTGNPFVAPSNHGTIPPLPLTLQGAPVATTVPTPRTNDWVHPGVGPNPTQLLPQMPPPAVARNPMTKSPSASGNKPNQKSADESANTVPMNVDSTKANSEVSDVVNQANRIIRNETQSGTDTGDKNSNEEKSPTKVPTSHDVPPHVVMATLVTILVEAMRLQAENPKWDPLEHSQSIFERCRQGKYASTLFEAAFAFSVQSTNGNPTTGDKDGHPITTASNTANTLSALGTLADLASESNSGDEVQVATLKPLDGWNRLFVGTISDDLPHGVGCLACSQSTDDKQQRYMYGCWSKGYLIGRGWETYANGSKYNGAFQQGIPKGSGKMIYANGLVREGDFETWNPVL